MPDYASQLVEVNAAISAILTGAQSYSIAGRSLSRGDLGELLKERRRLEALVGVGVTPRSGIPVRLGTPSG